MKKKKIDIFTIAKEAGVSVATVSRAMNDSSEIKAATKEKILKIIKKKKYHPNVNAKRLVQQRTNNIGIIFPYNQHIFLDWYLSQLVNDLQTSINKYRYDFSIYFPKPHSDFSIFDFFEEGRVDGMIVGGVGINDDYIKEMMESSYKFILLGSYVDGVNFNYVDIDNKQIVKEGIKYLYKKGHRKIGTILDDMRFSTGRDRYLGYQEGLADVGLEPLKQYILPYVTNETEGFNNAIKLLKQKDKPTAIFTMSDLKAADIYKAARTLHLKIPDDISVLSIDDTILSRSFFYPSLTTFKVPTAKLAELATESLVQLIRKEKKKIDPIVLVPELIKRNSVKTIKRGKLSRQK